MGHRRLDCTLLPVDTTAATVAAAQAIFKMGVANVVVSLGKKGALLASGTETWLAALPQFGKPARLAPAIRW